MRKFYSILLTLIISGTIFGQAPAGFKYQTVVRNSSGQLITNTQVTIQIAILKGSISGTSVYTETFNPTTNNFGLANLNIGSGTVVSGNFSTIDWGADTYYIKVWLNTAEMGASQLLSVPYALYSKKAETISSSAITGNENAFTGWDKNSADDFNGNYNSLTGIPSFSTVATSGSYSDLTNKPTLFDGTWTSLTGKPTFATVATSGSYTDLLNKPVLFDGTWTSLTGKPTFATIATSGLFSDLQSKPTTLAGYGITNAMSTLHPANAITSTNISNWNTSFGWGNHAGLYRPISYVPTWGDVTGKPNTLIGYGITDAVAISGNQTISGNKTFSGTTTVSTPVNPNDAATKAYVDQMIQYVEKLKDFMDAMFPIPTAGLVAYYSFSGNANDMSGNNLNGIIDGATLVSDRAGLINNAYYFNKNKIIVADNDLLDFTNQFSLCAWFKSDNNPDSLVQGILGKSRNDLGGGYDLSLAHPGNLMGEQPDYPKVGFSINTGSSPIGGVCEYHSDSLIIGWHFIVGTYDGSKMKLYVDGILRDSLLTDAILPNFITPLYIGRSQGSVDGPTPPGDTVRYFYGKIDDVRLYNRALNTTEIQSLYFEGNISINDLSVTDVDGNSYKTVEIGTQVWFAENLKTTKYNDNTPIPYISDKTGWMAARNPAFCFLNDDSISFKSIYGGLYNWYTVNTGKLCPSGWHVPSNTEWNTLDAFLGGAIAAGPKLMETGTIHWPSPNTIATNESGFTALPAGYRDGASGNYYGFGTSASWFTSTEQSIDAAFIRDLYSSGGYTEHSYSKNTGYSIRCIKD